MASRKPKAWAKLWLCLLTDEDFIDLCQRHGPIAWAWAGVILAAAASPDQDGRLVRKLGPMSVAAVRSALHLSEQFQEQFQGLFRDLNALGWVVDDPDGSGALFLPKFLPRQETPKAAYQRDKREQFQSNARNSSRNSSGNSSRNSSAQEDQRIRSENTPPIPPAGGSAADPTPEPEVLDAEVLEPEVVEDPAPVEKPKRTRAPKDPTPEPEIPEWVPRAEWDAFDLSRQRGRGKASWTATARTMALRTLADLRASGEDPAAVLRASVVGGWSGLFPVKRGGRPVPAKRPVRSGADLFEAQLQEAERRRRDPNPPEDPDDD